MDPIWTLGSKKGNAISLCNPSWRWLDGASNLVKIYELTFPSFLPSMAPIGFKGGVRLHSPRSPPSMAFNSHNTLESSSKQNRILFIVVAWWKVILKSILCILLLTERCGGVTYCCFKLARALTTWRDASCKLRHSEVVARKPIAALDADCIEAVRHLFRPFYSSAISAKSRRRSAISFRG